MRRQEPRRIADFEGVWRLERRIEDFRANQPARAEGEARIVPGDPWTYDERMQLHLPGVAPVEGHRRYLWVPAAGGIEAQFADGRAFHRIDLGGGTASARHPCGADLYDVQYEFVRWPVWSAVWRVRGPRKDYLMTTIYRRAY